MMLIELFTKWCSIAIIAGPMRNTSPLLAQKAKKNSHRKNYLQWLSFHFDYDVAEITGLKSVQHK